MIGTIINVVTIILGGMLGMMFGIKFPERVRQTVIAGLGLFTAVIGVQMFLNTHNPIIVLGALLLGGVLGEIGKIETRLSNLGSYLEKNFAQKKTPDIPNQGKIPMESGSRFIRGFLTSSLLFCVGPMAILGSIQDGLTGDFHLLAIKSILDGFASLAFASSLGIGVLFSAFVVLTFQGGISLLAAQAQAIISDPMMNEMTAVGGILLLGLAISSLLEIKKIRVGNFLPSLLIAPILVAVVAVFG